MRKRLEEEGTSSFFLSLLPVFVSERCRKKDRKKLISGGSLKKISKTLSPDSTAWYRKEAIDFPAKRKKCIFIATEGRNRIESVNVSGDSLCVLSKNAHKTDGREPVPFFAKRSAAANALLSLKNYLLSDKIIGLSA